MTISVASESEMRDMNDALADLEAVQRKICTVECKNMLVPMTREGLQHMRKMQEELDRHWRELHEKWLMIKEFVQDQFQHLTKHSLHRTQGRVSSKGKTSAKKASTSGNGGNGGGEGDGPHRTRTRSKQQRRSSRSRNTRPQRPPSSSPGAITNTSPQSPPPPPSNGHALIAFIVVILLILVIVLLEREERDMAWSILGPLAAALISYIKPPSKKR